MIKRFCNVCGKEINRYIEHEWRDGEMQYYQLVKKHFDDQTYEIDICNECLHKVVALTRGEFTDMGGEQIRCKDCKYGSPNKVYGCRLDRFSKSDESVRLYADDFCSCAERRGEE